RHGEEPAPHGLAPPTPRGAPAGPRFLGPSDTRLRNRRRARAVVGGRHSGRPPSGGGGSAGPAGARGVFVATQRYVGTRGSSSRSTARGVRASRARATRPRTPGNSSPPANRSGVARTGSV